MNEECDEKEMVKKDHFESLIYAFGYDVSITSPAT